MKRGYDEKEQATPTDEQQKRPRTEVNNPPNRTLYLGNLHPQALLADVCDVLKEGVLENVRFVPAKRCAFVSFMDEAAGIAAHTRLSTEPVTFYGRPITVGYGQVKEVPANVNAAVAQGATRNVFFGGSVDRLSEPYLRDTLSRFGAIDSVDILIEKKIAFVHFTSISAALLCKEAIAQDPKWSMFRTNFGKDRCASDRNKPKGPSMRGPQMPPPSRFFAQMPPPSAAAPAFRGGGAGVGLPPPRAAFTPGPGGGSGNRTVYVGGVNDLNGLRELIDDVHEGSIEHIKLMEEKHCCFLSFIDPMSAGMCFEQLQMKGVKVGWGKQGGVPREVQEAIAGGATRNVFLGQIETTPAALLADLASFGVIEKVDVLPAKK